jgi:KTSC domain
MKKGILDSKVTKTMETTETVKAVKTPKAKVEKLGTTAKVGFSTTVSSSWIHEITYAKGSQMLMVMTEETTYVFNKVPSTLAQEFIDSDSQGKFFNANVRKKFESRKFTFKKSN